MVGGASRRGAKRGGGHGSKASKSGVGVCFSPCGFFFLFFLKPQFPNLYNGITIPLWL